MLKVKLKDLDLAMEYIKTNGFSEFIEFDFIGDYALSLSFIDKSQKSCIISLYEASKSITPDVRQTSKLYKKQ